ncbi:MAG: YIP1 family protein [Anaerolineae bacterium]
MLTDRIVGAFTFRSEVYAEVETDTDFTTTAWIIVAAVAFLNAFGATEGSIVGAIAGTAVALIGFAAFAFVVDFLARSLFRAEVTFSELVRTLGLAYVWRVVGLLAIVGALGFLVQLGSLLSLIASFIAVKEAVDLEWVQTIVTVVIGWIVLALIVAVVGSLVVGAILGTAVGLGVLGGIF